MAEFADDALEPYLVCPGCHARLMARSLRPREWFNLAKRHGWSKFLLHDDFYDDDGTASQPEDDVEHAELFPAPSLTDASNSAESLLDYSVTRWRIKDELVVRWKSLPVDEVLDALNRRFGATRNAAVRSVVLEVAALTGTAAEGLVQRAWQEYPEGVPFWSLVQASAACLPFEEGFARAEQVLTEMGEKDRREAFPALAHFRSPRALSWIEANACEPSVEAWGRLAAASSFSWPKVKEWLSLGRPLSLIAIDALMAIADPRTPLQRSLQPALGTPPSEVEMRGVLESAAAADPVPRVKQRIGWLLTKLPALTNGPSAQAVGATE